MQLYDLLLTVESDLPGFLDGIERYFCRSLVHPTQAQSCTQSATFGLLSNAGSGKNSPMIVLDGRPFPIRETPFTNVHGVAQLLLLATSRVRSHVLVHAGVVSRDGSGVLLVADSMHGKTTLVLELVRRGFRFLSDEIAALSRTDGRVHPYPRAVSIRGPTFDLLGISPPLKHPNWFGKFVFDIDELFPGCLGGPVPVKHLILLYSQERSFDSSAGDTNPVLLINRLDDGFLAELATISGITSIDVDERVPDPTVCLRGSVDARSSAAIADLCRRHDVLMLSLDRPQRMANFSETARLEPISASEGVLGLMRSLHAGYHTKLVQEMGSARIFSDLAAVVQGARCHRLHLGPVQQNADLICGLFQNNEALQESVGTDPRGVMSET